jgi:anti-sigma-K factor RskA
VEQELIHELVAAYALDALDDSERRNFEDHLAACEQCREELEGLRDAAAALAYVPEGPAPPPALRERVLKRVHDDRGANVVPLRRRLALPAVATFAVAAAAAAIVLAVWGSNLSSSLDRKDAIARVLATGTRVQMGASSHVVVGSDGRAVVVSNLGPAPAGKTYELWVIQGDSVRAAGLFGAGKASSPVLLERSVPKGAQVGISIEKSGGVSQPTHIIGETTPV